LGGGEEGVLSLGLRGFGICECESASASGSSVMIAMPTSHCSQLRCGSKTKNQLFYAVTASLRE